MGGYLSKRSQQNEYNIDQMNLFGNIDEIEERKFSSATAKFKIRNTLSSNINQENVDKS
jgi:hypothetical protein